MTKFESGSIICESATIQGDVAIGTGTVVHPLSTIISKIGAGAIIIGSGCIIEEGVSIVNHAGATPKDINIGDGNLFQVGAQISCYSIGSHNVFGAKCAVSSTVRVGSGCTVGATLSLSGDDECHDGNERGILHVEDGSVLFRVNDSNHQVNKPQYNEEWNRAQVESYRRCISDPSQPSFLGKHHKLVLTNAVVEA